MPLLGMRVLLERAKQAHCAVGAFNVFNLESAEAVLSAAVKAESPIIIALAESHLKYNPLEYIGPALIAMARNAPVPVTVQLDHSKTTVNIRKALDLGFGSVMWDGYDLPYEEKIAQTREVVEMARAAGAAVEAPLGRIGKVGDTAGPKYPHDGITDPGLVGDFCERTGIDALAVAIGSVHGMGRNGTSLDFDRLKQIGSFPGAYLSLHGGSGVADDDYRTAISLGVAKVSIFTRVADVATQSMADVLKRESPRFPDLLLHAKAGITAEVTSLITIFNSKAAY